MLNWFRRRQPAPPTRPSVEVVAPKPPANTVARQYQSLYRYLENRYADTVVLTFGQIEDLLGFALPDLARLHKEWWTNPDPAPPRYSDSWTAAGRTAMPSLLARTVAFERAG